MASDAEQNERDTVESQSHAPPLACLTNSVDKETAIYEAPSHIRSLPSEILSEIFLIFVAQWMEETHRVLMERYPFRGYNKALNNVMSVCSSWRCTALAEPRLWTLVGVFCRDPLYLPWRDSVPGLRYANYWETWERRLERARSLPLSVYFDFAYSVCGPDHHISRAFQALLRLIPRATNLDISLHLSDHDLHKLLVNEWIRELQTLPPSTVTRAAKISAQLGSTISSESLWRALFSAMTALEELDLEIDLIRRGFGSPSASSEEQGLRFFKEIVVPTCGRTLRCLSIYNINTIQLSCLLHGAPNLKHLHVKHLSGHNASATPWTVLHTCLSTFCVNFETPLSLDQDIFAYLTLPALQTLEYTVNNPSKVPWPSAQMIEFIERSDPQLKRLQLAPITDYEVFDHLMPLLVTLVSLDLNGTSKSDIGITNRSIAMLLSALPALESLSVAITSLQITSILNVLEACRLRFVESNVAQLKYVDICINGYLERDDHSRMYNWYDRGEKQAPIIPADNDVENFERSLKSLLDDGLIVNVSQHHYTRELVYDDHFD